MGAREDKSCSCGGILKFLENAYIATKAERFTALAEGWLNVDIYSCETCGKVEFYSQKKVTAEEKLEELYRSYTDRKLRKIVKDEQYRQDARTLAQRILDERDVTGEHE